MSDLSVHADDVRDPLDAVTACLTRSGAGDTAVFADLYDALASRVHGLVLRVVGDPRLAEDVTVAVFLEVWRTAATYDPQDGSAVSWVLAIAHRHAVDRARSTRSDDLAEVRLGPVPTPAATVERHALDLAYLDGFTRAEVSRRTGASPATTASRIRMALVALRDELGGRAPA